MKTLNTVNPLEPSAELVMLDLHSLEPDGCQAREVLNEELVARLAQDIEASGLHYPLLVRPLSGRPGSYGVYDGWHRLAALQRIEQRLPGTTAYVPCRVRELDDVSALVYSLNVNLERGELSALEQADVLARLHRSCGLTWKQVQERTHFRHEAAVRNLASTSWNVSPGLRELNRIRPIPASVLIAVATRPEEVQLQAGRLVLEGRKAEDIIREVDPTGVGRERVLGKLFGIRKLWLKYTDGKGPIPEGARSEALQLREALLSWVAQIDEFLARSGAATAE